MEVESPSASQDVIVVVTPQLGIRVAKVEGKQFSGSYKDFWTAVENGDLDTVKQMLEDGADPDRNNWMNQTVLHEATERGHTSIVDTLISYGADINRLATDQQTCLHIACEKGHFMVASALINAGANIKAKDRNGDTPLYLAVKKNRPAIVALLLTQDKSILNLANKQGKRPTDLQSGGDVKKLLSGEIDDPAFYSSGVFASLDSEAWEDIQMDASSYSESDEGSGTREDSDEDMA